VHLHHEASVFNAFIGARRAFHATPQAKNAFEVDLVRSFGRHVSLSVLYQEESEQSIRPFYPSMNVIDFCAVGHALVGFEKKIKTTPPMHRGRETGDCQVVLYIGQRTAMQAKFCHTLPHKAFRLDNLRRRDRELLKIDLDNAIDALRIG
jgi:hypothetical protein